MGLDITDLNYLFIFLYASGKQRNDMEERFLRLIKSKMNVLESPKVICLIKGHHLKMKKFRVGDRHFM